LGEYGSVRGTVSNHRSYREPLLRQGFLFALFARNWLNASRLRGP